MPEAGSEAPAGRSGTVTAVRHAIAVLRVVAGAEKDAGVSEIARRIGMHKSSVSRIAATLEAEGLIERDPATERLRLGPGLVALAAPLLLNLRARDVARPYLEDLARRSGETISFNIWDGREAIAIEQAVGSSEVAHFAPPGMRNPAHCTAAGKALLAHAPEVERRRLLATPLARFTERTITDRDGLAAELARIRAQGYAINGGEYAADIGAVAAIVREFGGAVAGAIAATVPMYRFDHPRRAALAVLVAEVAVKLSQRLGHAGDGGTR